MDEEEDRRKIHYSQKWKSMICISIKGTECTINLGFVSLVFENHARLMHGLGPLQLPEKVRKTIRL